MPINSILLNPFNCAGVTLILQKYIRISQFKVTKVIKEKIIRPIMNMSNLILETDTFLSGNKFHLKNYKPILLNFIRKYWTTS